MMAGILTASSLTTIATSASAAPVESVRENTTINSQTQMQIIGENGVSKELIDSSPFLASYMELNDSGLYTLNEEAKNVVSSEAYDQYLVGLDRLNNLIETDVISVVNGDIVPGINAQNVNNTGGMITTQKITSNPYWWGYAITFDNQSTKFHQQAMAETAAKAALLTAILAAVPAVQAAAVSSALASALVGDLALLFNNKNKGKGVTLNLHWLPVIYYEVTTNNG